LNPNDLPFFIVLFIIATAYSSVGHGGASSYLALMALSSIPTKEASTIALVLNIEVSIIALVLFQRAKHLDWSLTWPFLLGGIPLAFVGGSLKLSDLVHEWVLGAVLVYAAIVLLFRLPAKNKPEQMTPIAHRVGAGAGIGLVSGMVGVGGGIFLSPLMVLFGWASTKQTAATSAVFIFANSIAGLSARPISQLSKLPQHVGMIPVVCLGAILGAYLGAQKFPDLALRRVLGGVLLLAVFKLIIH
jgi:uncharacterized membrane protein YfcA